MHLRAISRPDGDQPTLDGHAESQAVYVLGAIICRRARRAANADLSRTAPNRTLATLPRACLTRVGGWHPRYRCFRRGVPPWEGRRRPPRLKAGQWDMIAFELERGPRPAACCSWRQGPEGPRPRPYHPGLPSLGRQRARAERASSK
eukprot:scaffold21260_cov58-Phaeocystis_antarctica.AAC.7